MNTYTCPHCGSDLCYNGRLSGKAHYYCVSCDTTHTVNMADLWADQSVEYADTYRTWAYNGEEI